MYFTNDSMLPENQQPLIITVAPYGPRRSVGTGGGGGAGTETAAGRVDTAEV